MNNILEQVSCIFCGSNKYQPVYSRIDARYSLDKNIYTMNRCAECDGYYLSPRVREEYISAYYPNEFYLDQDTPGEVWKKEFTKNKKKYETYLRQLKPGKLLDVGCRDGSFVKFMELFGWQAEGFEYNKSVKNRFDAHIYYENLYQFHENNYDVITLWAVLEHLYHPNDYLKYFYNILRPDGYLIIQVPKFNSFTGKLLLHEDVPRHLSAYTSNGLIAYIEKFGFELDYINTRCTIFNGSSIGFLQYLVLLLLGSNQSDALCAIYNEKYKKKGKIAKLDLYLTKYLDILLRRFDYWGQMTAIFKKKK